MEASPRRESFLQRHEGDSPVISMKRLMNQLLEELEALRGQQDGLLKQLVEQRKQDVEHRAWLEGRMDKLERTVQDATTAASALLASSFAAANHANPSTPATASATPSPFQRLGRLAPVATAHPPPQLLKTASFEFARHHTYSGGGEATVSGAVAPPVSPFSRGANDDGSMNSEAGASPPEPGAQGGSPRSRRFRMPSPLTSDDDEEGGDNGEAPALAGQGRGSKLPRGVRSRRGTAEQHLGLGPPPHAAAHGKAAVQTVFAAPRAQMRAVRDLAATTRDVGGGAGGSGVANVADGCGREEASLRVAALGLPQQQSRRPVLLQQQRKQRSKVKEEAEEQPEVEDALPSFAFPDSLTSLDSSGAAATASGPGSGGPAIGNARDLHHWYSQGHSSFGQASSISQSLSQGLSPLSATHGHTHGQHHHLHHHHHHSHSQGSSHPFFKHARSSSHGAGFGDNSGGGFGSVALLFHSLVARQHSSHGEFLWPASPHAGAVSAAVSSSPTAAGQASALPPAPASADLREALGSGGATPVAGGGEGGPGGVGGGGLPLPPLDLSRLSAPMGPSGGGAAPSLARDSVRSGSLTEHNTERVEAVSVKHFKGIPPRLVEIYRQRADLSHWSLLNEPALLSRGVSRRGSCEAMVRPAGLMRYSTLSAAAGPAGGAGGSSSLVRMSLLHGAAGKGGGGTGAKEAGYEELSPFGMSDPNYDHPRMIGDNDEYDRPLTMRERLRLYCTGLIRPEGRTKWDLFILTLLVWVLFASPVIICFGLSGDVLQGDWMGIVELCVDFAFMFDIVLNFRTAYYDSKGHLVTERWRIARHYLKTWFLLDLICVIPYDLITAGTMGFLSMLKLLRVIRVGKVIRMIKMYRLLRVIRLPRILERMEMFIDRGALQVMAFLLSVALLAHLSACVFFYMAYLDGLGPQTWVAAYGVQDADLTTKYLTSLYWAFTTTATVGYGDITPKTDKEKVIAIFVMCLGVSLVGYVTSSISNIMAIKNAQQTNIANRKQLVMDVLKTRSVPSELSRRVYNYFDYASSKMIKREEAALLAELPFKLRSRMLQAFHADMLSRVPAISRVPPHVLIELVSQLKPHYFVEGDIVAMQGDYIDALYIVSEGLLEVRTYMFPADVEPWRIFEAVHKDELKYMPYSVEGRLKPRCMYGQAGVLYGGVWPATVIARNCCELYGLDREGLEHMLALQPELQDMLGLPRAPITASVAHAASLSGPGTNPLLPPTDRSVLHADFPIMDAAPQRGLMQSMLRSMGNMITGGLARASAAHYPNMPGAETGGSGGGLARPSWRPGAVEGGGGGGTGRAKAVLKSGIRLMSLGLGKRAPAEAAAAAGPPEGGGGGGGGGSFKGSGGGGPEGAPESTFSRFRPFGARSSVGSTGVQLPETSRLLNGGDRSDSGPGNGNGAMTGAGLAAATSPSFSSGTFRV